LSKTGGGKKKKKKRVAGGVENHIPKLWMGNSHELHVNIRNQKWKSHRKNPALRVPSKTNVQKRLKEKKQNHEQIPDASEEEKVIRGKKDRKINGSYILKGRKGESKRERTTKGGEKERIKDLTR